MSAAVLLGSFEPGSPQWCAARRSAVGGSEIAAVLGLSPWESRFSLWHRKAGLLSTTLDSDATARGRLLEPAIAAWFAAEHPEFRVRRTGTWVNRERRYQLATPDRRVFGLGERSILEIKSAVDRWEWGAPGTDEIPVYYRAQVLWQLDALGLRFGHVAVLTSGLEFRAYLVEWNEAEAELLRGAAREFLDSVARRVRPDLDEHGATHRTVRALHLGIDDVEVEINPALAARYRAAVADHKTAESAKRAASTEVLDVLGDARRAVVDGESIAVRVPGRGDAPPSLRPSPIRSTPQKVSAA